MGSAIPAIIASSIITGSWTVKIEDGMTLLEFKENNASVDLNRINCPGEKTLRLKTLMTIVKVL